MKDYLGEFNLIIVYGFHFYFALNRVMIIHIYVAFNRHLGENARMVVIANAGHAVNLEKPKEFAKHLKDFLHDDSFTSFSTSSRSFYSCISEDELR